MCLERVFIDEEMEEWLADKPEVIEVYKIAVCDYIEYKGPIYNMSYIGGLGIANLAFGKFDEDLYGHRYYNGFYFFESKEEAVFLAKTTFQVSATKIAVIKCLVKKEWITAIGESGYWGNHESNHTSIGIVASQAVFPHYPETEARYEDMPQAEALQPHEAAHE